MKVLTSVLILCGVLALPSVGFANARDDEFYCRFFQDGANTDPQSLAELVGSRAVYHGADDNGDEVYYYQRGRLQKGVMVSFSSNQAWSASAVGFEPGVNYWECDED
jgi:hypothetical protein